MSTSHFSVQQHTLPCAHIREFARATADTQEDVLHLAIKQYTPLDNPDPQPGDLTIIGAHANGFPKELYEPLWDEVYIRLKISNIRIRNIWIADVAHQGQSSVLNEDKLGDDPSWFDHPRDLFLMINHFRAQMPRPIVGIGHSMGGSHLVNLSFIHPRLFSTLVLIDPVMQRVASVTGNFAPAQASTLRRDRWPSRAAARAAFQRSKFYQTWDPRVLDLWISYGLRDLPTLLYPEATPASATPPTISADIAGATPSPAPDTEKEVTLTTTKHQEVLTFVRPNFPTPSHPNPGSDPNPLTHPDIDPRGLAPTTPSTAPNRCRPSYASLIYAPASCSGGAPKGRVKEVLMQDTGHLIPMEKVQETSEHVVQWLVPELGRWREADEAEREEWRQVPKEAKARMSGEFVENMLGGWLGEKGVQRKGKAKL
ncbi:hypothetical protein H2203_001330 [Taxawa tesnikishii (nom. ined.)]|nr:hypothetical protein H2203_001330 [Dothideales sp. JES 119]